MSEARRRAFLAVAIPLGALAGGALVVWSISRILLAADVLIAPVIGILVALNVLIGAALAASAGTRRAVTVMAAALLVPIVAFGVVGAVVGERPVEPHHAAEPPEEPAVEPEGPAEQPPPEEPEPPPPPEEVQDEVTIVAENIAFDLEEFALPADTEVSITIENRDANIPHNISIYTARGGDVIHEGEIFPGVDERAETFTTPGPGAYYFVCDVHPNMNGTVTVV